LCRARFRPGIDVRKLGEPRADRVVVGTPQCRQPEMAVVYMDRQLGDIPRILPRQPSSAEPRFADWPHRGRFRSALATRR
jgi:hypothetical protein